MNVFREFLDTTLLLVCFSYCFRLDGESRWRSLAGCVYFLHTFHGRHAKHLTPMSYCMGCIKTLFHILLNIYQRR